MSDLRSRNVADAHRLPRNSEEVLVLLQRIRRQHPHLIDEMNLLIDALDGEVSIALDAALAKHLHKRLAA